MIPAFSLDQIKTFISSNPRRLDAETAMVLARQLYDAMQENERLNKSHESVRFYDFDDLEKERKAYKQGWDDAMKKIGDAFDAGAAWATATHKEFKQTYPNKEEYMRGKNDV